MHFSKTHKLRKVFGFWAEQKLFKSRCYSICNCRIREESFLQNQHLTPYIIYRADVQCEANNDYKFYLWVAQTPIKERFWNHNTDFSHRQYIKSTELSKYIWTLKDTGTPDINHCKS